MPGKYLEARGEGGCGGWGKLGEKSEKVRKVLGSTFLILKAGGPTAKEEGAASCKGDTQET